MHSTRLLERRLPRLFVFFVMLASIAGTLVVCALIHIVGRPTPHQNAIASVLERDGSALSDEDGYILVNLKGGSIPITDASLRDLVPCRRLRQLTAYGCSITDDGLSYLVGHRNLRVLHLDGCSQITDAGVVHLVQISSLRELSLSETQVTQRGIEALRKALPKGLVCDKRVRTHDETRAMSAYKGAVGMESDPINGPD
jgi:hypothetical protein